MHQKQLDFVVKDTSILQLQSVINYMSRLGYSYFAPNQFNVVGGSHAQRKQWLAEKESLIGKWITVKYQTLYKDTKIPQFPTLVSFRETDSNGNPLE